MRARWMLAIAVIVTGCYHPSPGGYLDPHAFYASRQHYRVRYVEGREPVRGLMPADWQITSHQLDARGAPVRSLMDPAHATYLRIDTDGDMLDDALVHEPSAELHFEHAHDPAEIWVRTLPLAGALAHRSLDEIAASIVEALVEGDDQDAKWRGRRQLRLGARVVEHGPVAFGADAATPGHGTVVEILNLDAPPSSPEHVAASVALVLARPSSTWSPGGGRGDSDDLPMTVVFLYVAARDVFAMHRGAFENLLDRTDIRADAESRR